MGRLFLLSGVVAAVLYFLTIIIASLTWPGYSHVTQYASELGSAAAPYPGIFNGGIIATGVLAMIGGIGVIAHFVQCGRPISGGLAGLSLIAWGVGMLFGGLFPMPNPLHNGFGLVLGIIFLPGFLMIALRGRANRRTYIFLAVWLLATATLLAVMFGAGGLVTTKNVGLWQRGLALAMIPGMGIICAQLYLQPPVGNDVASREPR